MRGMDIYSASIQIGICRAVKVRGRLDALPPAFTRGVAKVAHTGAGGSPSSAFVSQKGAKNKNSNHRKIILFDALVPGIRTPPVPALAQGHPPHKCGGQGRVPHRHRSPLPKQPYKFQFSCLLFYSRQKPGLYTAFRNRGPQGPEIWAHNGGKSLARRRKTGKKPGKEM